MRWSSYFLRSRFLLPLLFVFFTASCGSTVHSTTSNTFTATTPTTEATSQALKPAYNYAKSQKTSNLFIHLNGFICTQGPFLSNLTIMGTRLSFDAGSAQIIQNYLQYLADNAVTTPETSFVTTWVPPQSPNEELRWVAGSTKCTGNLVITNTGQAAVEIQRFGMQLTGKPMNNSYHYQRIPIQFRCNGCGGSGSCAYTASVTLNGGSAGSLFDSPIASTDQTNCPLPIRIPAQGSAELSITLQDAAQRDLIYTGVPMLVIKTVSGNQSINLPDLTSSLFFTDTDAFPCYQFQNDVFVSESCPHV